MASPSPPRFPKSARLRAAPDFQAVFKNGLKRSGVFFRLYFLIRTESGQARLGLAVPKKMAPLAVTRNRIKRLCRETFRQHPAWASVDIVLVAQAKAKNATSEQLRRDLTMLFTQVSAPADE